MTLVEVIIATSLLGIVSLVFTTVLASIVDELAVPTA